MLEGLPVSLVSPDQLCRLSLELRELRTQPVNLREQRREMFIHFLPLSSHVPDTLLVLDEDSVVVQAQRVKGLRGHCFVHDKTRES